MADMFRITATHRGNNRLRDGNRTAAALIAAANPRAIVASICHNRTTADFDDSTAALNAAANSRATNAAICRNCTATDCNGSTGVASSNTTSGTNTRATAAAISYHSAADNIDGSTATITASNPSATMAAFSLELSGVIARINCHRSTNWHPQPRTVITAYQFVFTGKGDIRIRFAG